MILIRIVAMVILLSVVGVYTQHLIGDHVCKHEEKYKVTIEKHSKKNITLREFVWCMSVPPRCSKYKIIERDEIKIEEEDRIKEIYTCCDGYEEDSTRTYCIPVCETCVHGVCQNPNSCVCSAGFTGESCNQTCTTGLWGQNCISQCDCMHGASCNPETGSCICDESWTGLKCEIPLKANIDSVVNEVVTLNKNMPKIQENVTYPNVIERENMTYNPPEVITTSTIKQESTTSYNIFSHPQMEINNKPENTKMKNIVVEQERVATPSVLDAIETSKKNSDDTGKMHQFSVKSTDQWRMDEIQIEDKIPFSDNNYYYLIVCLVVGVVLVLIIITVMSIMIARYKKQRNLAIKHSGIHIEASSHTNKNRLSTQPILERSIFHAPLPDPPIFKNPVYTIREDKHFCNISADSVQYHNNAGCIVESTYDYPPSSGSCRKFSIIPEPSCEPVYDEIPSWRRPRPVTCPSSSAITGINPYRHSCCETNSTCEWNAINL